LVLLLAITAGVHGPGARPLGETHEGHHLAVAEPNPLTFDVSKGRELGYLLIKAAERHDELVKQIALIEVQRQTLIAKQESLMQERMK
jgi:hypothetical protein